MFYEELNNNKVDGNNLIMASKFPCFDCGKDTFFTDDYYMIHNDLWLSVMPQEDNCGRYFLCVACLEKRLGRKLQLEDLTDVEINETFITKVLNK